MKIDEADIIDPMEFQQAIKLLEMKQQKEIENLNKLNDKTLALKMDLEQNKLDEKQAQAMKEELYKEVVNDSMQTFEQVLNEIDQMRLDYKQEIKQEQQEIQKMEVEVVQVQTQIQQN